MYRCTTISVRESIRPIMQDSGGFCRRLHEVIFTIFELCSGHASGSEGSVQCITFSNGMRLRTTCSSVGILGV